MLVFIVDTNLFLQFRDLQELPWGDLSDEEDILLLIPQQVIRELDKLKYDVNKRRSKRARQASSFIKKGHRVGVWVI